MKWNLYVFISLKFERRGILINQWILYIKIYNHIFKLYSILGLWSCGLVSKGDGLTQSWSYCLPLVPDLCTTGEGSKAIRLSLLLGGSDEPWLGAPDWVTTEGAGVSLGVVAVDCDIWGVTCGIGGGTVGPVIPPPLPTVLKEIKKRTIVKNKFKFWYGLILFFFFLAVYFKS